MVPFNEAIQLIKTFEGFHEKACDDPSTGEEDYIIGYGTTFYPDGSPVRKGHLCTRDKALEYLNDEIKIISTQLIDLNLGLDLVHAQCISLFCSFSRLGVLSLQQHSRLL
jgi:GH24 family phage-related lysozyme (muramidase)